MKTVAILPIFILISSQTFAAGSCSDLKQELLAMQKAQQQIISSLVSNHESFAASLEEYSTIVKTSQRTTNLRGVVSGMEESAQVIRARGVQGKKMASKLDGATSDLLARVAACLK